VLTKHEQENLKPMHPTGCPLRVIARTLLLCQVPKVSAEVGFTKPKLLFFKALHIRYMIRSRKTSLIWVFFCNQYQSI